MNNKLKERLADALGYGLEVESHTNKLIILKDRNRIYFTPETDDALFKRCLVELMNEDHSLDTLYSEYWVDGFEGRFNSPEEAVFTAFVEMKEGEE